MFMFTRNSKALVSDLPAVTEHFSVLDHDDLLSNILWAQFNLVATCESTGVVEPIIIQDNFLNEMA